MSTPNYLLPLEKSFVASANQAEAMKMKKYMKDLFDFYGIKSPIRKELYKTHKQKSGLIPSDQKTEIVRWCWNAPQREWQYFAMDFLGREAKKADKESIELYEFMTLNKSWWDTVDFIAANLVGTYFQKYPDQIPGMTKKWMSSGNMWLQRTCILFQLKYRKNTDTDLLKSFIDPLKDSKEFFIRKAIGWALREYSKNNPVYVKQFVKTNQLSGLSHREALKWMSNNGLL
jgi:3-methyladenine DNA glycosylase AlkD